MDWSTIATQISGIDLTPIGTAVMGVLVTITMFALAKRMLGR